MLPDTLSLKTAVFRLRAAQIPNIDEATARLMRLRSHVHMADVLREYAPDQYGSACEGYSLLPDSNSNLLPIEKTCLDVLQDVLPLDTDWMEQMLLEDGETDLRTQMMGCQFSYDEMGDLISVHGDELSKNIRLAIFLRMLYDHALFDEGDWQTAIHNIGWPIEPPYFPKFNSGVNSEFDRQKFFGALEQRGLSVIVTACSMAWRETGNVWLDYNSYEQEIEDDMSISVENVRLLTEQWESARPLIDEFDAAAQIVADDPELIADILQLYGECITIEEGEKPPRTLLELWAQEIYGFDPDAEIFDDPFYGPIGEVEHVDE